MGGLKGEGYHHSPPHAARLRVVPGDLAGDRHQDSPGDEPAGFGSMLERNPGLCLGAILNEALVGCVLGGWDGRRGWVHHLAVHPDYQRRGLGQALMADLEQRFAALGVPIVNLLVYCENSAAMAFYERLGYAVKPVVEMGKSLKAE